LVSVKEFKESINLFYISIDIVANQYMKHNKGKIEYIFMIVEPAHRLLDNLLLLFGLLEMFGEFGKLVLI